ncbi:hypothetical protein Tco_1435733, partial [Tanacetum coccineum]
MFRATLKLPMETPKKPFIPPATLKFIQLFLKIVGYQGLVDKIFHVVVNKVNVDYASLLWWDFIHCVRQKKTVIQYPRFKKLIIAGIMSKFESIPLRLEEEYHALSKMILRCKGETIGGGYSGTRIEPGSHKENPKTINDDDDAKKDDKKDDEDHDDNDDHDDNALIRTRVTGSLEITTEKMQTPIPSPPRSYRKNLSSDKAIAEEVTHMQKNYVTNRHFHDIKEKVDVVLHDIVPKIASNATNDLIDDNIPRNTVLNVYPTTSTSTATTTVDLQHQIYLNMKSDLQSQVADPELWDVLKRKFEKTSTLVYSCRDDAFPKRDHDEHEGDDGPPEEENSAKRQKTSKGSKSIRGSSSK